MEFYTIGVYNSTEKEFFSKLTENCIDTFCDIRQRRGVRGSKYAFVNSNKLQEKLNKLGIKYGHILELAPTLEIRQLQKDTDIAKNELKSERVTLGNTFITEYKNRVINTFDFDFFIENLENIGAKRVALFCVEETAKACHRSIVGEQLTKKYNYIVTNL